MGGGGTVECAWMDDTVMVPLGFSEGSNAGPGYATYDCPLGGPHYNVSFNFVPNVYYWGIQNFEHYLTSIFTRAV